MEILDKNTPGFTVTNKRGGKIMITFSDSGIFISSSACREFDLNPLDKIHFIHDLDRLYFFINEEKSGFSLFACGAGKNGLRSKCITMINILKKKMPTVISPPVSFPLKKSVTKLNGHNLIEILIHKKP
jgi:hypothetical protein